MPKGKRKLRPFAGVDGEGGGRNRHGQQHYLLLATSAPGVRPLYTRKPLTTVECLEWITALPPDYLYVGFAFGYDATMILRDLPAERIARLFEDKPAGEGKSRYTWYQPWEYAGLGEGGGIDGFAIEYLPRNYLRVARLRQNRVCRQSGLTGEWRFERHVHVVPGTSRTIWETFGDFQKSFLATLRDFDIGREHWARIEKNKAERSTFTRMTPEIRRYNQIECALLAELMERFRGLCHDAGFRPSNWAGAGKLASAAHREHGTITAEAVAGLCDQSLMDMAASAYYGGRFEVTRTGEIAGPVFEYDINSAYPDAMRLLPCLAHGQWERFWGEPPLRSFHIAYCSFSHPPGAPLCCLPIRKKDGRLFWPREGQGVYWSVELDAARRAGAVVKPTAGWRYIQQCDCRPFDWIEGLYETRRAMGKDARGYPIKLAINALYGKLAQRIGAPRWGNLIWAGLITAVTRAKLIDAGRLAPDAICMFATDAVVSRVALDLPLSGRLGDWEAKRHERLFVVQPGLYWAGEAPSDKRKTRGVSASIFAPHIGTFETHWRAWCASGRALTGPPVVSIPVPTFTGLRLAHARGKPETAGRWVDGAEAMRGFSFDWTRKRAAQPVWESPWCVRTMPAPGAPDLVSVPHKASLAVVTEYDLSRMEFEDMPDPVDLGPPV